MAYMMTQPFVVVPVATASMMVPNSITTASCKKQDLVIRSILRPFVHLFILLGCLFKMRNPVTNHLPLSVSSSACDTRSQKGHVDCI